MPSPSLLPSWAAPLDCSERFERFCELVSDVAATRFGDDTSRLDPGSGELSLPDGAVAWLGNLAATCATVPTREWRLCIYEFLAWFDDLRPARLVALVTDWAQVRSRLRLRLFPAPEVMGVELVHRLLGGDTCVGLAADVDGHAMPIPVEHADGWGKPRDAAWAVAERNLAKRDKVRARAYAGHGHVMVSLTGGLFTTGHALRLGELGLRIGRDGALVAAPTARDLLVVPIGPSSIVEAAAHVMAATAQLFLRGPNALTTSLFWYRGPRDLVSAVEITSGEVEIVGPEPLAARLRESPDARPRRARDDARHEHPGESSRPHGGSTPADG